MNPVLDKEYKDDCCVAGEARGIEIFPGDAVASFPEEEFGIEEPSGINAAEEFD